MNDFENIGKREKLRAKFKKETGFNWGDSHDDPDIYYVEWLESKLFSIPDVVGRSEQLSQCKCGNTVQVECDDCKDDRIRAEYI